MANNEIVTFNHFPVSHSSGPPDRLRARAVFESRLAKDPELAALCAAADALNAAGIKEFLIVDGDYCRQIGRDQAELRRLHALADERFLNGESESGPPRLWSVKKFAERLGVESKYVYRHADEWPFIIRLPGGVLRVVASEAAAWLKARRA